MDPDELVRIVATLETAIAEARVMAKADMIDEPFRELMRHAHGMHDLLVEALLQNEPLASPYLRGLADSTGNAIDELDARVARADGAIH
jgi:hypothetical protein